MKESVLVVDADEVAAGLIRDYLLTAGLSHAEVRTAADAMAELRRGGFSILISELALPDAPGMELIRRARALDPDIAVIAMTTAKNNGAAQDAFQLLPKPFRPEELAFSLGRALERRQLLIENRRHQTLLEERVSEATAELMRANAELRKTKDYLESLLDTSLDTVITSDTSHLINYANRGAGETLGHLWFSLVGCHVADIIAGGGSELGKIIALLEKGPIRNREMCLIAADRRQIPVIASVSRLMDPEGRVLSTLFICKDMTQQKELERELKELTIKDSLTSLYNQRYFFERLDAELERSRRQYYSLSLLLFDVDNFKTYNDEHGHLEGDKVLMAIGEVVRDGIRDHVDTGYRYGGDEFVVILPETGKLQAKQIAERIRASFEARHFGGCTLSVGIMTSRGGATARELVRLADTMMYDAKRSGGNRVYIHDPDTGRI